MFSRLDSASLNLRTDVAQTPVSTDGKIFSTSFLPAKSDNEVADKSVLTSSKDGAFEPTAGSSPIVSSGLPYKVTVAIVSSHNKMRFTAS